MSADMPTGGNLLSAQPRYLRAEAFIHWKIKDARLDDRRSILIEEAAMRKVDERFRAKAENRPRHADHLLDTIRKVAAERRVTDPMVAIMLGDLAEADIGSVGHLLAGAPRAFLRFRNPAIAALAY